MPVVHRQSLPWHSYGIHPPGAEDRGSGNVYVTLAKMMLREKAEIDFPAGPSEIGIIADSTADPASLPPISLHSRARSQCGLHADHY